MCGIVGVVGFDPTAKIDPLRIELMRDQLEHRGPDGAGCWVEGATGLGHRRLAIVDVAGGHQPMANEDESVWVVFNGEIYNHAEIRSNLVARGHSYQTRSDTETILHVYDEYGVEGFRLLEGMFAFALWDRQLKQLVLVRDRLGIKPLYFAETADELLFASEIKALIAGGVRAEFNEAVLGEYLAMRLVSGKDTLFRGVHKLEPGHLLTWTAGQPPVVTRYWSLPATVCPPLAFRDAALEVRGQLQAAVRRHLMSDVPLGVFLSGGLDSSALAAIAATMVPGRLQTFAVGFRESESNELPYAREVAKAIGSDHHETVVGAEQFFEALPHLIWNQDEPMAFSSGVPLYFLSEAARERVKVVLTGEGADELFLGYNRYRVTFWNERLGRPYRAVVPERMRRWLQGWIGRMPASARRYAERTFLAVDADHRAQFFDNFSVFPDRTQADIFTSLPATDPYAFGLQCYREASGGPLERMAAVDLQTYLCELLTKQDRMSMAASIESRVPFLDDQFVDLVSRMPGSLKLRGWKTKAVLRAAVADLLPASILTRRKMGFPVPLARWLRGAFRPVIDEFVLGDRARDRGTFREAGIRRLVNQHQSLEIDHTERLWLLINLEIWRRMFLDGDLPSTVMRPVWRRTGRAYASSVDQGGRVVAAQHGWATPDFSDNLGTVPPAPGGAGHHARPG